MDLQKEIMDYFTKYGHATVTELRYATMFKYHGVKIGRLLKKLINDGVISRNGEDYTLNK